MKIKAGQAVLPAYGRFSSYMSLESECNSRQSGERGIGDSNQQAHPPSIPYVIPVMKPASSPKRNATKAAHSSGSAIRLIGVRGFSRSFGATIWVLTAPG